VGVQRDVALHRLRYTITHTHTPSCGQPAAGCEHTR
jgi:hypothetical protein